MAHEVQPKVVIGHPHLGRGGSEARVMWLIEALKDDFDITVVTTGGWDLDDLNDYYGTNVSAGDVTVRIARVPIPLFGLEAAALRYGYYQRFAHQIAREYDIRISAYNLTNWGLPGIHFLADFSWDANLHQQLDPPSPGFVYRNTILRRGYLKFADSIRTSSSRDPLHQDLVIANSQWSAELMKKQFGVVCAARVYPPVSMASPQVPWDTKKFAFAMIGRIAPEKEVERAIAILDAVRQRGHAITLHICGKIGNDAYGRRISRLCHKHFDWIIQEGPVAGQRKARILASCQYGIQTRNAEPFGISVAEMIKSGAIVFAPRCGGQSEILGAPELLFSDADEAVEKICSVLTNDAKQTGLRAHLARRAGSFSAQRFQNEVHELILRPPSLAITPHRSRPKVVIGHPFLGFGGSESVVMWLIEALKHDCEVTVLTTGGWNLPALNAYYGTRVNLDEVHVRIAPIPLAFRQLHSAALRGAWYQRFAREVAREYDLRISAYNLTDWGLPAIHFIADFSWHSQLSRQLDSQAPGFIYRDTMARRAYLRLAQALGKPSDRDILRDDTIIGNSYWSSALLKERCGVECAAVVYPPVWEEFPHVRWEDREFSFVMIGRIAPEKRIEYAIQILDAVRERGYPIKFHLCGEFEASAYGRHIAMLCEQRKDWIVREGQVSGSAKRQILTHCRFGIQTRGAEPFGISVAEMVKAGAIVFAPNDGGQTEVLGTPSLLFTDLRDAVHKISAVLANPQLQSELRAHLKERVGIFHSGAFLEASRAAISQFSSVELPVLSLETASR